MSFRSTLDQHIDIQRYTSTRGGSGSVTKTWAKHILSLPCAIQPMSGDETLIYGRETGQQFWKIFCEYHDRNGDAYDITLKDKIVWGSVTMDILAVKHMRNHHYRIEARETT